MVEKSTIEPVNYINDYYNEAIKVIDEQKNFYPNLQIGDIIKLIFQMVHGCGHFVTSRENCLKYLLEEVALVKTKPLNLLENIGGGWWRVHLDKELLNDNMLLTINNFFVDSSSITSGLKKEEYFLLLKQIKNFLQTKEWFLLSDLELTFEQYFMQEYLHTHHTNVYRLHYEPHYRIIHAKYIDELKKIFQMYH